MPLELVFFKHKVTFPQVKDVLLFWFYPTFGIWIAGIALLNIALLTHPLLPIALLSTVKDQAIWAQLLAAIFLGEVWFYLAHRCFHSNHFLWKFHKMHHSIKEMSWSAAFRAHPVDFLVVVMGANFPALLLGIELEPIVLFIALERLHTVLLHSNVNFDFGWLGKLIVSPQYHHLHHEYGRLNHNYAGMFVFLDVIGRSHRSSIITYKFKERPPSTAST